MEEWHDPYEDEEAARERERRRGEREARRRERTAKSRGALGDRVKNMMSGETPANPPPPDGPEAPPAGAPATPAPPSPPRPPRGPRETYWRRRLAALGALLAAIAVVALAAALIHHVAGGGGSSTVATQSAPTRKVTIPEGYDRHQIADIAKQAGIKGDYLKASEKFKGFDPAKYGAQNPQSLEGFLFPATYDLPRHPNVDDLVPRQLDAFKQNIASVNMSYAKSKNLTVFDVVTIASMIEREVAVPKERKLVAAVIYNRLHAGMPLQIDATIRFATNNFTQPVSQSDLKVDSPYNTYTNPGLPIGPIGNPGLDSLQAAAHPAQVSYLYYVVKPNTCGELTFATTKAQFDKAEQAYEQARAANGGNAPTPANCPG